MNIRLKTDNLHIHAVTRVDVESETIGLDSGNGYIVHRIDIHADSANGPEKFRVTLYGNIGDENEGAPELPFNFSKVAEVMS